MEIPKQVEKKKMKKLMMIAAAAMLGLVTLTGCGPSQAEIEKAAKSAVEDMCKKNGLDGVKCSSVKITKKIDSKNYEADAKISIGGESTEVPIKIKVDGKKVIVTQRN